MRLNVTYDGKDYELPEAGLFDFVMLERQFGISAKSIEEDPRVEFMAFLAYVGLRKLGVVAYKYSDEFLELLTDLKPDADEDEAAADPTTAASQPPV